MLQALVIALCIWGGWMANAATSESLDPARFASPSGDTRILKIIHNWPDAPAAQDQLIDRLLAQGFGGVVCNVSFDQYLESPTHWEAFRRACETAHARGMSMWLYDEKGYPSGMAGGLTLRGHPEWQAQGLLIAEQRTDGQEVTLSLPPGDLLLLEAYPVIQGRIDVMQRIDLAQGARNGTLQWQPPKGSWQVLGITMAPLHEGTHADNNLFSKERYPNLMSGAATRRFIEVTHEQYLHQLPRPLGEYFQATFTDEPSLMSLFLRPMPYRVLPWAAELPAAFEKRHGRALPPLLPRLLYDTTGVGERIRYDFWATVGDLTANHYFGQIQLWCQKHGIRSGGHLLMEESMVGQVPLYGDFMGCLRRLDAPSIDCLTSIPSEVQWRIARLASSAAELENRSLVMSETSDHVQHYRGSGDKRPVRIVTEDEMRGTLNRLMVAGINSITSYYSFADLDDAALRRLNEWVGRIAGMLRGGHQVADIAVLHPVNSLWSRYVPARHLSGSAPGCVQREHLFNATTDLLFAHQRDFTVIDAMALDESRVENGELVHGQLRWRCIVLPGADTLPSSAWKTIKRFLQSGGMVIAIGATPANTDQSFPAREVQAWGNSVFGTDRTMPSVHAFSSGGMAVYLPTGFENLLPSILDQALQADFTIADGKSPLRVTHRHVHGSEVFFVINDSPKTWNGSVCIKGAQAVREWNPATGTVSAREQKPNMELSLGAYGGVIFTTDQPVRGSRLRQSVALPSLTPQPLPGVKPTVGRGEFVRETLEPVPAQGTQSDGWRARATLTKGQVDTYLFLSFPYEQTQDLSQAEALVLDTVVPEGQATSTELLLVLRDKDGTEYLARTGRSLSAAGRERTVVPLSRFEQAGWSQSTKGTLDTRHISEVRVGWGGYYGSKGETVDFTTQTPSQLIRQP